MPQWSADESAVYCHFGHPGAEVVAMFGAIMGNPRGEDFLEGSQ